MEYFVKIGDDSPISLGTGNGGSLGVKSLGDKVITRETTVKLYFNCTKAPKSEKTWNPVIADLVIDLTAEQGAPAVASVELSEEAKTIATSEAFDLTATVKPDNAEDKTVTWSIVEGDDKVTLSATTGKTITVTGATAGQAKVRATAGEKTADCVVTVMDAANSVKVTVTVDDTQVAGSPFTLEKGEHTVADLCELINVDPEEISEATPAPTDGKYDFQEDTSVAIALRKLESIAIKNSDGVKKVYYIGEEFDPTGLVITATYDSKNTANKTKDITVTAENKAEFTVNDFDSSAVVASQSVTITWNEKTTAETIDVEIKSYGNVPYVEVKEENNTILPNLAAITDASKWYGYVKGKRAYTSTSNVNEADNIVSIVDGGTQTMAYYVLPTPITTDTTITGKVTPKTQKGSWTFLQLVDVDDAEFIGLRTKGTVDKSDTDMTAAIRTDASTPNEKVGTVTQTITKDVEYNFTINCSYTNNLVEIILQKEGESALRLPAQKFTNANGIKAVKIFGNSSSVSIKDVAVAPVTGSAATSISISEGDKLELEVGDEQSLTAIVEPIFADMSALDWSSDTEGVATVADGKVTAVAAGTANITATLGEKTATVEVEVKAKLDKVSWFTENVDVAGTIKGTFLTAENATYTGGATAVSGVPKWQKHGDTTGFYYETGEVAKGTDWFTLTLKVKASAAGKLKSFSYIAASNQQTITSTVSYKVNSGDFAELQSVSETAKKEEIGGTIDLTSKTNLQSLQANDVVEFKIVIKRTSEGKGAAKLVLKDIVIAGMAD